MAQGLKRALLSCLVAGSTAAAAQLADPTRPPLAAEPAAAMAGARPSVASGLQSVILRKKGKPAALINGEIVELGGKVGESRLVKVSEDAVVLKGPAGVETLRLMPSAEKRTVRPVRREGAR
jgi:MSHA biogenesis protein MshK